MKSRKSPTQRRFESQVYDSRWRRVRRLALARDRGICQIRGPHCRIIATEVDHIVPWRSGGSKYDLENLRAACRPCNRGRVLHQPARRPSKVW